MLSTHTIKILLGHVHAAEAQLIFYEPASALHHLEASYTLYRLHQILSLPYSLIDEARLIIYLKKRWGIIEDTDIQYLHDFVNPANVACISIAKTLGLILNQPYLTLLMPSLCSVNLRDYITSSYRDEDVVDLQDIVLSDCNKRVIYISDALDSSQEDGVLKHNSLFMKQVKRLSERELDKILTRHESVKAAYDALQARVTFKLFGDTVGANLNRLIQGLRLGGVHKHGHDDDSGLDANTAIVVFSEYLETLSDETKETLMAAGKFDRFVANDPPEFISIATTWQRLTRPLDRDYRHVTFCVEVIANRLEEMLESNPGLYELVSYEGEVVANFDQLDVDVIQTKAVVSGHLRAIKNHAYHGEAGERLLCRKFLAELRTDHFFVLNVNDIAYIAESYFLAKTQGLADITEQSECLLIDINERYSFIKLTQAIEKMSLDARQRFIELTGFTASRTGGTKGLSFFKPVVEKRSVTEAELEETQAPARRKDFHPEGGY
jgi:hypothetical protein